MKGLRSDACAVLTLLALAATVGCSDPGGNTDDPGPVALRLFALADAEPGPEELERWFEPELLASRGVPLLDALDGIAGSGSPTLLAVETAPGAEEAFVDLAVSLPGGGRAVYNVKLRRLGEDGWRIAWFQGPGVEWPPREERGASLTTSAPPGTPDAGW